MRTNLLAGLVTLGIGGIVAASLLEVGLHEPAPAAAAGAVKLYVGGLAADSASGSSPQSPQPTPTRTPTPTPTPTPEVDPPYNPPYDPYYPY